ncbi:MAG: hypothetical protein R2742_03335 [Micropruina glycogenica]
MLTGISWEGSRLAHQLRLETRGLVTRSRAAAALARGTVVTITAEGQARIEAAAPGHVRTVRANCIDLIAPEREVMGCSCCAWVSVHRPRPSAAGRPELSWFQVLPLARGPSVKANMAASPR